MSRSKEMDLTTGNPFWSLLKFAIPVILGNLFQLFYTLADSVIVGKTLGADSLAAVRACTIRLLSLGHAKYEKVAIYAVNQRISNIWRIAGAA